MQESISEVEYRNILEYPGYRVGNDGSVWSCWERISPNENGHCIGARYRLGNVWKSLHLRPNRTGYPRAALYAHGRSKRVLVHLLVLKTFRGPCPPGMYGCHENDIKIDCRLENLRWDTPQKNWDDRKKNGRADHMASGEQNGFTKVSSADIVSMRLMKTQGIATKILAEMFHISSTHAWRIVTYKIRLRG